MIATSTTVELLSRGSGYGICTAYYPLFLDCGVSLTLKTASRPLSSNSPQTRKRDTSFRAFQCIFPVPCDQEIKPSSFQKCHFLPTGLGEGRHASPFDLDFISPTSSSPLTRISRTELHLSAGTSSPSRIWTQVVRCHILESSRACTGVCHVPASCVVQSATRF